MDTKKEAKMTERKCWGCGTTEDLGWSSYWEKYFCPKCSGGGWQFAERDEPYFAERERKAR